MSSFLASSAASTAANATPMDMDHHDSAKVEQPSIPLTPSSLPRGSIQINHQATRSDVFGPSDCMLATATTTTSPPTPSSLSGGSGQGHTDSEPEPPFEMDDDDDHHETPVSNEAFSSNILIRRPFRARYAHVDRDEDVLDDTIISMQGVGSDLPDTSQLSRHSTFKRTHDQVSPATGSTPPLYSSRTYGRDTSYLEPPPNTFSAYDSQRASASSIRNRLDSSILRRRSPALARQSADEDRSKRRRSEEASHWDSIQDEQLPALSAAFAPALGSPVQIQQLSVQTIDPTLNNGESYHDQTNSPRSRRSRLSLPSLRFSGRLNNSSLRSSTKSTMAAPQPSSPPAEQRRAGFPGLDRLRRLSNASIRRAGVAHAAEHSPAADEGLPDSPPPVGSSSALGLPYAYLTSLGHLRPRPARTDSPSIGSASREAARRTSIRNNNDEDALSSFWHDEQRHARAQADFIDAIQRRLQSAEETLDWLESQHRDEQQEQTDVADARFDNVLEGRAARRRERERQRVREHRARMIADRRLVESLPSVPFNDNPDSDQEDGSEDDDLPVLPSVQHLVDPDHAHEMPPVIGVRLQRNAAAGTNTNRTSTSIGSSLFQRRSLVDQIPPAPPLAPSEPTSPPPHRLQSLLTSLRTRRPTLSRDSTRVSPPPAVAQSATNDVQETHERDARALPADTLHDDVRAASSRMAERSRLLRLERARERERSRELAEQIDFERRVGRFRAELTQEDNSDAESFGQVVRPSSSNWPAGSSLRARRMRGPTERSNELWRQGVLPGAAEIVDVEPVNSLSRRQAPPATPLDPSSDANPRSGPPALRDDSIQSERFPWSREESPSPPRRRHARAFDLTESHHDQDHQSRELDRQRRRSAFLSTFRRSQADNASMNTETTGTDGASTTGAHEGSLFPSMSRRPTIRITRTASRDQPGATNYRAAGTAANFGIDDDEDDERVDLGYGPHGSEVDRRRPRTPPLPLMMLPSGSSGRRIVANGSNGGHLGSDAWSNPLFESNLLAPEERNRQRRTNTANGTRQDREPRTDSLFDYERLAWLTPDEERQRRIRSRQATSAREMAAWLLPSANDPSLTDLGLNPRSPDGPSRHLRRRNASNQQQEGSRTRQDLDMSDGPAANEGHDGESNNLSGPRRRRRSGSGIATFLRGLRQSGFGGGARAGALFFGGGGGGLLDDDFPAFFGHDSAALDPRNYLADEEFDASYESLLRLSERLGDAKPKGVSEDKMSRLEKCKYSEWPAPKTRAATADKAGDETDGLAVKGSEKESRCAICLTDYEEDDEILLGHCEHGFHSECLMAWLKTDGHCPLCRRDHS